MFLEYGCWLELAYELFRLKKCKGENGVSGTWQEWLTVYVGICSRYSQMLREVKNYYKTILDFKTLGYLFQKSIDEKNKLQIYCKQILLLHATGGCRPH